MNLSFTGYNRFLKYKLIFLKHKIRSGLPSVAKSASFNQSNEHASCVYIASKRRQKTASVSDPRIAESAKHEAQGRTDGLYLNTDYYKGLSEIQCRSGKPN